MNLQEKHRLVEDAISQLSAFNNGWTFDRIGNLNQWKCIYDNVEEARVYRVEVCSNDLVHFHVEDRGSVRFNRNISTFTFSMDADELSDESEQSVLREKLVDRLNELHGM